MTDWLKFKKEKKTTVPFLDMKEDKKYKCRVVGKPQMAGIHWIEREGKKMKIKCAGEDCILCEEYGPAKDEFTVPVIDRTDGNVKVLSFGRQIFSGIVALAADEGWGDPTGYDITIDRSKARGPSDMYQVLPNKPTPLSKDESANVAAFLTEHGDFVKSLATINTNENIAKRLGDE